MSIEESLAHPGGAHPRVRRRAERPQGGVAPVRRRRGGVRRAPTSCARTSSSSRATRTCRWSSTRRSPSGAPTASSRSGPRPRRRTTSTGCSAKILDMPPAHIRVIAAPVGGGFGGKLDPFAHEIAACKLSQLTGRPVKITLTREEVFYVHRGRHPVLMWIKTGFTKDGAITGMHFRSWLDGGAYGSYGVASTFYTGALQTVTYKIPVYKFEGARIFTNKPPCGPKRGHGTPQPRFAMECQIDKAAEQLGLDPADMRRRNLAEPFTKTANHLTVTHDRPRRVHRPRGRGLRLAREARASCRRARASASPARPISPAPARRSTGTTCRTRAWSCAPTAAGCVAVLCGATDIGQGSDSILAYLVGRGARHRAQGHPRASGRHRPHAGRSRLVLLARDAHGGQRGDPGRRAAARRGSSRRSAKKLEVEPATGSSRRDRRVFVRRRPGQGVSFARGGGARREHARRARLPGLLRAAQARGQVQGRRRRARRPATRTRRASSRWTWTPRPGRSTPTEVWIAHDVGRALNPLLVEGQVEGSVYMGLGEALMEEQVFRKGVHKIPSHARVQEPDHARDAGDPHHPRRDRRSRGPVRRQGSRAGAAAARDPGGRQRGLRRASACASTRRRSRRTRCSKALELQAPGQAGARRPRAAARSSRSRSRRAVESAFGQPAEDIAVRPFALMMRLPPFTYLAPGLGRRRGQAHGRPRARGHAGGRRDRSLPEHEAAAVRADGAGRAARDPRPGRRPRLGADGLDASAPATTLTAVAAHPEVARALPGAGDGGRARLHAAAPQHGHARRQRLRGHALQLLQPVLRVAEGHRLLHEEGRRDLPGRAGQLALLGGVVLGHRARAVEPRRAACGWSAPTGERIDPHLRALPGRRHRVPHQAPGRDR